MRLPPKNKRANTWKSGRNMTVSVQTETMHYLELAQLKTMRKKAARKGVGHLSIRIFVQCTYFWWTAGSMHFKIYSWVLLPIPWGISKKCSSYPRKAPKSHEDVGDTIATNALFTRCYALQKMIDVTGRPRSRPGLGNFELTFMRWAGKSTV